MAHFQDTYVEPVRAWGLYASESMLSGAQNLPAIMDEVYKRTHGTKRDGGKVHHTPGFFLHALRSVLERKGCSSSAPQKDWGGFQDVGEHTNVTPPHTEAALVHGMLRHVAGEVWREAAEHECEFGAKQLNARGHAGVTLLEQQ